MTLELRPPCHHGDPYSGVAEIPKKEPLAQSLDDKYLRWRSTVEVLKDDCGTSGVLPYLKGVVSSGTHPSGLGIILRRIIPGIRISLAICNTFY